MGIFAIAFGTAASLLIIHVISNYLRSPLKRFPGPFAARFTDLWRFAVTLNGQAARQQQRLHCSYGKYVRLGPKFLSISDPDMIKIIYTVRNAYPKSAFYSVSDLVQDGKRFPNQFSVLDEAWHTRTTKPINKLYSLQNVLAYEPLMDSTISELIEKLHERFVRPVKACDMDNWLHYYAWDVISEITFSRKLGFLEKGSDVDGLMNAGKQGMDYTASVGQIPFLDNFLDKNPIKQIGPPSFGPLVNFAVQRLMGRMSGADGHASEHADLMDRIIATKDAEPEIIDQERLVAYLIIPLAAGNDTVAIACRSITYFVLRHERVHAKLRAELDKNRVQTPVSWKQTQQLPYFDAVVKEALRLHAPVGLPLERVVDERGLQLSDGTYLPEGTIVGINAAVVHRNEVFGERPDEFLPERWLQAEKESSDEYESRLAAMQNATFTFGAGSRGCLGRHVALLEVYKVMASLFVSFEMELTHPEREWKVMDGFFSRQWDIDVNLKLRQQRFA